MRIASEQTLDGKYYVGRPWKGFGWPTLSDARSDAARQQTEGHAGSLVIYRDGEAVDIKRY